jgi:sarcosine oxidase, subunit beta
MADVAVIGGGLAGCATAYYLAADGVDVILLEQDDLNTRASGTNAGSLHVQLPHDTFLALGETWARAFIPALRLFAESIELWRDAEALLGLDLDVAMPGGLLVAADETQLRHIERKAVIERAAGVEVEILDQAALRARAPYVSEKMLGGAFCPQEGKADPLRAASAYGQAAVRLGARIMSRTTVRSLARENGAFLLETSSGPVRAARVVNAAGADADAIAGMLGVQLRLPLQRYPIQLSVTEPVMPLIEHLVYYAAAPLTLKQTHAGTILIGGGWPARLDARGRPVVDPLSLAANLGFALEVVPRLSPVNVVRTWAAIVNGTDDWLPQLGEVSGHPGFFMCYVPWLGFTAGPAAARLVASQVQGRESPLQVDPAAFLPGVALNA